MNKKFIVILMVFLLNIIVMNQFILDSCSGIAYDPDWGDESTNTPISTATGSQSGSKIISDGEGGAIIVWADRRSGTLDIYAQRTDVNGDPLWDVDGIPISTAVDNQTVPEMIPDGQGGAIILWRDYRSGTDYDVYAQMVDSNGDVQWTENGTAVCTATDNQLYAQLVSDNAGGAIITWTDKRTSTDYDIYAQKVNVTGDVQWTFNGMAISTPTGEQTQPKIVTDNQGGAVIVWRDQRGANRDIYAQRINKTGVVKWLTDGEPICTASGQQEEHQITTDGQGGAIIVWNDKRGVDDIYAQRIDANGNILWIDNGTAICTATNWQRVPQIDADGQGGALITWYDYRDDASTNQDVYAHKVDANGVKQWPLENGTMVSNETDYQVDPQIVSDHQGGAVITWMDNRGPDDDIYMQQVNSNGLTVMELGGKLVCNAINNQATPQLICDHKGNIIIVWTDYRAGSLADIYAARFAMYITTFSPPGIIDEDTQYTYNFNSIDDINATWTIDSNATWLTINPSTGVLSGTPNNTHVGWFQVNVSVEDNTGSTDWFEFTVTVFNVNDAPNITTIDVNNTIEDELYNVTYHAEDIDPTGDTLTWSFSSDADWLDFNTSTGNLSGIPTNDDVGVFWVNITVSDGNDIDWTNFSLEVINVNDAPELITDALPNAPEDEYYDFAFEAQDVDGPTLDWTIETNATWLIVNNTLGKINGTPTNDDVGGDFWVDVNVHDGFLTASDNFSLEVINVNDPPRITTEDDKTAYTNELYKVDYNAIDDDIVHGDLLTWSLNSNAGSWLTLNSTTGILKGTPTNQSIGEYYVNVTVNDGQGGIDFHNYTLTVEESLGPNQNPIITTIDVVSATVNVTYSVDYAANDDRTPLAQLTWFFATNATWLNFNITSKVLSGKPQLSEVGKHWVNITVNDGDGGFDFHNFTIIVYSTANEPPMITTEDVTTAKVNVTYSVDYEATDDRTPINYLQWILKTNASWLSIDKKSGVLSGKPMAKDIATYWVNVSVTDGEQGWAFHNFTVKVSLSGEPSDQDNHAPGLTNGKMTHSSGDEDTEFTFSVHYNDEDGDPPTSIQVVIDGVEHDMFLKPGENATDGIYEFKTKLPVGNHTYFFKANDGEAVATPSDDTPTSDADAKTTPPIKEGEDKDGKEAETDWMLWVAIIVIILIILAILAFAMMHRKPAARPPGDAAPAEEEELVEWEDEEGEGGEEGEEAEWEDEDDEDETEDEAEEDWDEE